MKILLLNGPNLNLLGHRQPEIYGKTTLEDIVIKLNEKVQNYNEENQITAKNKIKAKIQLSHFQSNQEGLLVERIQQAKFSTNTELNADAIIINPAAYTHTSIAIRDALLATDLPIVEVHLSNIHARESFRHHSYISDIAKAVICGMGVFGYEVALDYLTQN